LPGSRWRVWWRKVLTGAGLTAAAVGVFLAVSAAGGILDLRDRQADWLFLFGSVALAAYGWGVLGSVLARSSLTACGIGLGLAMLALAVAYPAAGIALTVARKELGLREYIGSESGAWQLAALVAGYSLMALPIPIAAWLFTAPDRSRKLAEVDVRLPGVKGVVGAGLRGVTGVRWLAGWRRLVWLTVRQTKWTALALVGAALVAGCALLPEEGVALAIWPLLGLGAGVLVGVVGLADEQGSGASRFWGERRMPVGRLWTAKVVTGLVLTLLLVMVLLVPAVAAAMVREDHGPKRPFMTLALRSGVLAEPEFPVLTFLLAWPAYGFAFGHLSGLLFRKGVVAGAVGVMVGGTLAALWLPSLLAGGVHGWQVFAAPVVALLIARLLTWPWVTERVGTRRPLTRLAVGAVAVLTVTAVGIGYRIAEVPLVADVEDDLAFAKALPTFDDKQAGRDLRRAVSLLSEADARTRAAKPDRPLPGVEQAGLNEFNRTYVAQMPAVLEHGWPADRPDLKEWLDEMGSTGWAEAAEAAARKPTGVLEDPAELSPVSPLRHIDGMPTMTLLYLARALQRQADGDPDAVPRAVAVWLAVVRTTRNDTLVFPTLVSRRMELQVYLALDRWLERLDGHPELLRAALTAVREHERTDPYDPQSVLLAQQVVARNAVLAPSRWLPKYFDIQRGSGNQGSVASATAETEANLVGFAWAVPWEAERLRRAVGLGNKPGRSREQVELMRGLPGWSMTLMSDWAARSDFREGHKLVLTARRAAMLKLAVRLYAAETGALPGSLAQLVPKYLPVVPADPYDGQPFRYRVSAGEKITQNRPAPTTYTIPNPPPGLGQFSNFIDYTAFAGIGGGLVCWPLEPGWLPRDPPPGVHPERLSEPQITAVAGTAGGIVLWPQSPDWGFPEPEPIVVSAGIGVAMPYMPWDPRLTREQPPAAVIEEVPVPAGQGILWSVGPDEMDNLGTVAIDPGMTGQRPAGDLVYLIPPPARPEEK
ncbi:MAG TPA: hypothetical protein VFG68_19615, partial [Fimbriiglobus sp.]|nr:hypothetical protein [Fimbriiglobus sp.]